MVSEAMPTRQWSAYTVGVSWPKESFGLWHEKGARALKDAEQAYAAEQGTRDVAERFADQAKGRFAGAQYFGYLDDAELYRAIGDGLTTVSRADNAIGDEVMDVKSHLDYLDWQAHEEIAKLDPKDPMHDALLKAIVAAAAVDAEGYCVSAGGVIAGHAAKITAAARLPERKHPAPPGGPPGKAIQESPRIDRPGQVKPMGNEKDKPGHASRGDAGRKPDESTEQKDGQQGDTSLEKEPGKSSPDAAHKVRGEVQPDDSPKTSHPGVGNAAGATPFSGMPGGSPGGGSGGGSPAGGLGSSLLGGGGNAPSSLASGVKSGSGPGGLGGASPANSGFGQGLSGSGARNPFADNLTRNFNNMYSPGPSTPLAAPPPAPPPTAAQPPAAPLATSPAGPAPVVPQAPPSAGPGTGAQMAPLAGVPGGGPTPGTGTTGGNMAPVGSDIARHAGTGAVPPPTAGPTPGGAALAGTTTTAAGGVATAGMVSPTYGATAGASAGSDTPQDPLLAAAVQLCFELQHGSRFYGILDWCVGVFRTADGAGIELVATSNDGESYIPAGVFLPRSARLVFSDPLVDNDFRDRWFGFTDPVATMMAYAEARRGESGELPLYALAATTLMGGGLAAADEAGVEHLHLCRYEDSPYFGKAGDQRDDDTNVHRLGMVDSELLSWWQAGDRTLAELTVRGDELTTAAHAAVSARLGDSAIIVPDVGLAVFNKLTYAEPIDDELWTDLYSAITDAHYALGSARPADDSPLAAELYRMRHDVARFLEVLWWWRPVVEPGESEGSIKFVEMAYCAIQILGSSTS